MCRKCKKKLQEEFKFSKENLKRQENVNFEEQYYLFKYKNIIRNLILEIKFNKKPYLYKTIETFLKSNKNCFEKLKKYDIIIIVPLSHKRQLIRGYNQSQFIGKILSEILSIKIEKNILYKTKNIIAQSTLNKEQRKNNVKGVYKAKNVDRILNKKILIIDDIYTTGSTLNECASTLVKQGIKKENIGVLTLAKD